MERFAEYSSRYFRERRANDTEFREREQAREREYLRRRRANDPEFLERNRAKQREFYANNAEYRAHQMMRSRQRKRLARIASYRGRIAELEEALRGYSQD